MLLVLASAVFLGSESLGTRDHILLSPTTRKVTVEVFDPASTPADSRNGSWSSLCNLGTDSTENTSSNISSIVACVSVAAVMLRLLSHYLRTDVFADLFPSNSYLWWLHNSGFQQTCKNIDSVSTQHRTKHKSNFAVSVGFMSLQEWL
jgi:hypothetical protein